MLVTPEDAQRRLEQGQSLFGPGWKCVSNLDDVDDDEYEYEEEVYVTMDLGKTLDSKALQTEDQYQLIGIDTPLPFLKIGNHIFQGECTPLIGDEVILDLVRDHENPQAPSHPPLYSTNHRITFRAVTLQPRPDPAGAVAPPDGEITAENIKTSPSVDKGKQRALPTMGCTIGPAEAGPSSGAHPLVPLPGGAPADHIATEPASSSRGRGRGTGRPRQSRGRLARIVVENEVMLDTLDLDSVKPYQNIELGPEVLSLIGLQPSMHGEGLSVSRAELKKIREERLRVMAERAGATSGTLDEAGGGPVGSATADAPQDHIIGEESTTSGPTTQEDTEMLDVDDDPPWQEVDPDGRPPA
ncbi:hypothetical protein IAU60_003536 [Kwoniella sp. DSM 27419]